MMPTSEVVRRFKICPDSTVMRWWVWAAGGWLLAGLPASVPTRAGGSHARRAPVVAGLAVFVRRKPGPATQGRTIGHVSA